MDANKKIAAIILAAGGSKRMGQPKLMLAWHGSALVRWVARNALAAGCFPVVVVTGADSGTIESSLSSLPLTFVHNPEWQLGQSTSVRSGVLALPKDVDAVIPLHVLQSLFSAYQSETPPSPILAVSSGGQRGNPVLFDRALFPVLTALEGDAGARTIFSRYPVQLIPFDDTHLLLDVDSPDDYQRLMELPPPVLPAE